MTENDFYLTPETMKIMDPEELSSDLIEEYVHEIPTNVDSIYDMMQAGSMLGMLSNQYSYMLSTLNIFKIWTKLAKKDSKEEYEKMAMRRDAVETIVDILKQQYNAISRMITIKQEINNELKMTDGK